MNAISRWGGLLGSIGGLIWAFFFFMEALNPGFDISSGVLGRPNPILILVTGIALQAVGFHSLSLACREASNLRILALICAGAAFVQSIALFVSSTLGFGQAWLLGIIGEMIITLALLTFAISSLATKVPPLIKFLPFLMVPFYSVGWSIDPQARSVGGVNIINLSASLYGLLWLPFGYVVWRQLNARLIMDLSDG